MSLPVWVSNKDMSTDQMTLALFSYESGMFDGYEPNDEDERDILETFAAMTAAETAMVKTPPPSPRSVIEQQDQPLGCDFTLLPDADGVQLLQNSYSYHQRIHGSISCSLSFVEAMEKSQKSRDLRDWYVKSNSMEGVVVPHRASTKTRGELLHVELQRLRMECATKNEMMTKRMRELQLQYP